VGLVSAAAVPVIAEARPQGQTRQRVLGVVYLLLAAIIAVFFTNVPDGAQSTFSLTLGPNPAIPLPDLVLPSAATCWILAAFCAFSGAVQLIRGFGTRWAVVLGLVALAFTFAFLTWATADKSVSLVGILQATVQRATPITFAALSGLLCERAGVVNIAIEGMLLSGAFAGAVVGSISANPWIGILAAALVGAALAWVLAVLAIRYFVDQIIAGTVINIFSLGITSFLSARVLQTNPDLNNPPRLTPVAIPVLSEIPIIGPVLFNHNVFVYGMFVLVIVIHIALFRTRWGLRVRAVGEHPLAADTVGINVLRTRYTNVIMAGMVAGIGGAYLTIGSTGSFDQNMSAGRGFIGLAAMIFGAWNPFGAFFASLIFGFADSLQARLSILAVPIPSEFLLMTPYIVTIIVVAGLVGRVRAPAADGKPYRKE
jgi:general nucleoside transport system permease protein